MEEENFGFMKHDTDICCEISVLYISNGKM